MTEEEEKKKKQTKKNKSQPTYEEIDKMTVLELQNHYEKVLIVISDGHKTDNFIKGSFSEMLSIIELLKFEICNKILLQERQAELDNLIDMLADKIKIRDTYKEDGPSKVEH